MKKRNKVSKPKPARVRINESLLVTDKKGSSLQFKVLDFKVSAMDEKQFDLISRVWKEGDLTSLSKEERESVKDLKMQVGLRLPFDLGRAGLIVRFDCSWVSIDGRYRDIEDAILPDVIK